MFDNIRADIMRVHRSGGPLCLFDVLHSLWINYGLQALVIYRFGRWLNNMRKYRLGWTIAAPLYPVYSLLSLWVRKAYGIDLDQSSDIAPGLYINHFGGIEVRNCRIGLCCNIQQHVKLGSTETMGKGPIIGDGVYIGAHAQIRTGVSIGDGATIGSGALVTQDVPEQCLAVGNPCRIIRCGYDNQSLM